MERSFHTAARLNTRRRFDERILRSQFRYLPHNSIQFSAIPTETRMATSYHDDDTPPRANTTPKPTMREAGMPLQPLNQNLEPSMDYMGKKRGQRDNYSYRPTPIREDPGRPSEYIAQPYVGEAHHYDASRQYSSRQPYYFEEEHPYSGYLEDDFDGIPPPPPAQHRVTPHYEYGPPPPPTPPSYPASPYAAPSVSYPEEQYSPPHYDTVPVYSPQNHRNESPPDAPWPTIPRSPGELQELDIVCGRGAPINYHYGNQVFKDVIQDYQTAYLCAKRSDKPHVAMKIMDLVKQSGARFVKREKAAGVFAWMEIDSKGAYEKVCQALREGAPDLRKKVLSASQRAKKGKCSKEGYDDNDTKGD
jgi:hypothetical protein